MSSHEAPDAKKPNLDQLISRFFIEYNVNRFSDECKRLAEEMLNQCKEEYGWDNSDQLSEAQRNWIVRAQTVLDNDSPGNQEILSTGAITGDDVTEPPIPGAGVSSDTKLNIGALGTLGNLIDEGQELPYSPQSWHDRD